MTKLILILLLVVFKTGLIAQKLAEPVSDAKSSKVEYWHWELSTKTGSVDSSGIALFQIEKYLNILNNDTVNVLLDTLSGYNWVVYPRNMRQEYGDSLIILTPDKYKTAVEKTNE